MTEADNFNSQHRPLVGGVAIMPSAGERQRGTLTAVARRANGTKVLVTCLHNVSSESGDRWRVSGDEVIYQGGTSDDDKVGQLYTEERDGEMKKSWVPVITRLPGEDFDYDNRFDIAALELTGNMNEADASFHLHEPEHKPRPIVSGCVPPTSSLDLILLGIASGETTPTLTDTRGVGRLPGEDGVERKFVDVIVLSRDAVPDRGGDSGGPLVVKDELGNYRMVGILFGSFRPLWYAMWASDVERELGITFGLPAPTAVAGAFQVEQDGGTVNFTPVHEVRPRETVYLRAAGSMSNIDGDTTLTYQWDQVVPEPAVGAPNVVITNRTQSTATFTAPAEAANLEFRLIVTDGNGAKAADSVTVNVVNIPPTANAGDDKTAFPGETVELNGSGNDANEDTLTYQWNQLGLDELGISAVTPVTINNADQATANFVAPDEIGALSFQLTVTDSHEASHSDTVTVTVQNRDPIALAGPDKLISSHNRVTLEGSVSDLDPDDRASVTHTWTQHGNNPTRVIFSPVSGRPAQRTFIPTMTGSYTFTLTATDQHQLSVSDDVTVRVLPASDNVIPANVTATAASGRVDINWHRVSMATGYEVQLGVPEDGGEIGYASYSTDALTHRVENLAPNTRYYYRVRAVKDSFVGPWSATASVVTPGQTPPTPTADQWDVQYLNNKIQVKLTELPAVIPAISEVKAILSIGEELDLTTVEKDIGTTLNEWVDVLTSSETDWQTGRWVAQIRFVNTSSSLYSIGKSVTVPNNPPTAKPGINRVVPVHTLPSLTPAVTLTGAAEDPDAGHVEDMRYSWRVDSAPGSSTRSASRSPSSRVILTTPMENGVEVPNKRTFTPDAIGDYVFTLTVKDPGDLTHSASVTIHACPANETSDWFDTGETRCHNNALQKRQTRRLSNGVIEFQWIDDPDNEVWGAWQDTSASHRNEEPGDWINRGGPSGFYNVSFQSQQRTVAYEKQQRRTSACGNTEERWIAASRRESRTKLAGRTLPRPRTPIDSQWEVRRMNNQIQVKVTSLPPVYDAIIEIRTRLESGSGSDSVTVIKAIGTTLNSWVTVLSSSDDRWSEGEWTAKIRFENSEKNSNYSTTKPVTVPTPPPIIDPWLPWQDAVPSQTRNQATGPYGTTGTTRNRVSGDWSRTGSVRENPVTLEVEEEQTRIITWEVEESRTTTWEKLQERTSQSGNRNETRWVGDSLTETRWLAQSRTETRWTACTLPDTDWADAGQTRVSSRGTWANTSQYRGSGDDREQKQTRTVYREKNQTRTRNCGTETQWVPTSSTTETQWVLDPDPCGPWTDMGDERVSSYGTYARTGRTRGSGANRRCEESRTNQREKQQRRMCDNLEENQWVPITSVTQTRWVSCPVPCGPWTDTGEIRISSYGTYSRTGRTRGSGANRECEESRTNQREKQQRRMCDNLEENRWVSTTSTTQTRWVSCPEEIWPDTWTDTGSIEDYDAGTWQDLSATQGCGPARERKQSRIATWRKEQFQRSNLGNRRTRWIAASRISFQWRDYPEPLRWGEWTDTGQRRENQVLLIIEKEQERTSHCNTTETRWVAA